MMMDETTVTSNHLALLAAMAHGVRWSTYGGAHGAPALDPKRPYGCSYDLFGGIASVVDPAGWATACEDESTRIEYEETHRDSYLDLHYETATVLRIVLACGLARPGVYERTEHGWRSADTRRSERRQDLIDRTLVECWTCEATVQIGDTFRSDLGWGVIDVPTEGEKPDAVVWECPSCAAGGDRD